MSIHRAIAVLAGGVLMVTPVPAGAAAPTTTAPAEVAAITMTVGVPRVELDRLHARLPSALDAERPAHPQAETRNQQVGAAPPAPPVPAAVAERQARRAAAALPVAPAAAARVGDFGDQPDAATVRDCLAGDNASRGIGRIHNRFTYCLRVPLVAEYWEIDDAGTPVEREGVTRATLEVFVAGDDTERRIRIWSRVQRGSVNYDDWGPIDGLLVAPYVSLSLIGQCAQSTLVCHATRGPATMYWTVWDNNDDWYYWDVYNHESFSEGRDKLSYERFFVEARTDAGTYRTLRPARTAQRLVRCDSASYFATADGAPLPSACVFTEAVPYLTYHLDSDYQPVAFHVYNAQFHPDNTYPLAAGPKVIPGRLIAGDASAPGLHRITAGTNPQQYASNTAERQGACTKTGPRGEDYFDTGLPVAPGSGESCAEYPSITTLEGPGSPAWDFAVAPVPAAAGRTADDLLAAYYTSERILAWDGGLDRPAEVNDRFYAYVP